LSCLDWNERITRYASGELSLSEEKRLQKHVRECLDCRAELSAAQELERRLRDPALEPLPAGMPEKIMAAIDRRERGYLESRLRAILRRRSRISAWGELVPEGILALAAVVIVFHELISEYRIPERLFDLSLTPNQMRAILALLGAQGGTFNVTYLYPLLVVISIGFGISLLFGLPQHLNARRRIDRVLNG
jgi:hypothetical protein